MVIHAIYENGVFRPIQPVDLPELCEVNLMLQEQIVAKSTVSTPLPLTGLAAIAAQYPENPDLPSDLAKQHDHYLYGTPKRS